jgi:hypothetical protein
MLVTGADEYTWSAYVFEDTYFKSRARRFLQSNNLDGADDALEDSSFSVTNDPLPGREHFRDLQDSVSTPREYFLLLIYCHLQTACEEWQDVALRFEDIFRDFHQVCPSDFGMRTIFQPTSRLNIGIFMKHVPEHGILSRSAPNFNILLRHDMRTSAQSRGNEMCQCKKRRICL